MTDDPFDPRELDFDKLCTLTCDYYGDVVCVVDDIDQQYLIQNIWGVTRYKKHPQLQYPRRMQNGIWIYLHREVMNRTGILQPTHKHFIVDHIDGETLNCTRSNLRWATPKMNRHNYKGFYKRQLEFNLGWQP